MKTGRNPDFIGIGAPRTATSWLFACLYEHPDMSLAKKEIHFFSREERWKRGFEWYREHFAGVAEDRVTGEYSTSYLASAEAPRRIADHCPDARIIASLRDPVERIRSAISNEKTAGNLRSDAGPREALEAEPHLLENSRYGTGLARYFDRFPEDRVLVLFYEDLLESPVGYLDRVLDFLGVDPDFEPDHLRAWVNPSTEGGLPWWGQFVDRASLALRESGLGALWLWLKKRGVGRAVRGVRTADSRGSGLPPDLEDELRRELLPEVERVEELTGRSLEGWKP